MPGWCSFLRRFSIEPSLASSSQQALEIGAERVLQSEGACDFAGADFAGLVTDEGEDVGLGGEGRCFLSVRFQNKSPAPKRRD